MPALSAEEWRERGRCLGSSVDMFPEAGDEDGMAAAKAVCVGCPVQAACLDYAVGTNQEVGVWGGVGEYTRRRLRRARRGPARRVASTRPPGARGPAKGPPPARRGRRPPLVT